jgi:hypothetical protein
MEDTSEKLAATPYDSPARRANRGWFRAGDRRINREGRPRGMQTGQSGESCTRVTDRVMAFFVPQRELGSMLTQCKAPWITNLPRAFRLVDCRVDNERDGVVFVIRSESFPRIARGTVIPEFEANFHGLIWR